MKKTIWLLIIATMMLGACIVSPGHRGEVGVYIAPPLPPLVVLEYPDEFYYYNDYYYHYRGNDWYYSRSKSGPWNNLPRDRHPREVRYKNRGGDRDRDRDRDKGYDYDDKRGPKDKGGHDGH